jgi:Na+:H+ antiporter, NhaC family
MLEIVLIAVFSASIFVCLCVADTVLPALLFGFVLFFAYGLAKGKSCVEMLISALSGVKSSAGVLVVLVLVGALTATWRASGTMAYMAEQVVRICPAPLILLMTFLLCSLVSFLIGSAFATAATVGTICVIVATSADVSVVLAGALCFRGLILATGVRQCRAVRFWWRRSQVQKSQKTCVRW